MIIRVDPAPGLQVLIKDPILAKHGVWLEKGQCKKPNKNPVSEKAIQELGLEILHLSLDRGPISRVTLALATANLNSGIRNGLSAWKLWTQRDHLTGMQLPVEDRQFILQQNLNRHYSHASSAKAKANRSTRTLPTMTLQVGDLVFLKGEWDKLRSETST